MAAISGLEANDSLATSTSQSTTAVLCTPDQTVPGKPCMPIHRVLVEAEQQVDAVAVGAHLLVPSAQRQEDVPSPDDRLKRVVRVEV